jgi:hypothetical protein
MSAPRNSARIAALNDACRTSLNTLSPLSRNGGGRCMITRGIQALDDFTRAAIYAAVRAFDTFTDDNDPYGEHDFGMVEVGDVRAFWKFDYYEAGSEYEYGSEDPGDAAVTARVMTIMLTEEY